MDKLVLEAVKEVCEKHECNTVLVTADGNIFLHAALNHAKNHAIGQMIKLQEVDSEGNIVVGDVLNPGNEIKTLVPESTKENTPANRPEPKLKDMNMGQLKLKVVEIAKLKGIDPITSNSKAPLIKFIEESLKLEDKPEGGSEGASGSGSEAGANSEGESGSGSEGEAGSEAGSGSEGGAE